MNRSYTLHDDTVETLVHAAVVLERLNTGTDDNLIAAARTLAMQSDAVETPFDQ